MAIAGSWLSGAVTPTEYAGSTRWGTGVNPIHAIRDETGRPEEAKLTLGQTDNDDFVPENILGASQWGYSAEDAAAYPGEDYRYLDSDHPNWGDAAGVMANRDGSVMAEGLYPQPEGFPAWGPHGTDNPDFPEPGWPGGADLRAHSDEWDVEKLHAIAVPTRGVSGGWLNKQHGNVLAARDADPSQVMVNTSERQLNSALDNTRATARVTDDLRTAIANRLTGMKVKVYGKSFETGGGPGAPDMTLASQDLPYRPWFFRQGATPPPEAHDWNEVTYFEPVLRSLPSDAGDQVTVQEADLDSDDSGYAEGDYYGG